jgi:cystathionine beta-lyase
VVTITSATKGFNIPALRVALMHFGSTELRNRFHARIPPRLVGQPNLIGVEATIAAWRDSDDWLQTVTRQLAANRARLSCFCTETLPTIGYRPPEGSYLAWLDCTALPIKTSLYEFFLKKARVAFSEGITFGPDSRSFLRLNFGTTAVILKEILERMQAAVARLG